MKNKIMKALSLVMAVIMCMGTFAVAFAADEIPEGYTAIYTAEDLYNIRNDLAGKYILMNDIDLSVYENWEPIGTKDEPFTGEINGNGYQIKNLTISVDTSESATHYYGLFGYVKNSKINNVLVVDADVSVIYSGTENVTCYAGTIVGYSYESAITNSVASGKIGAEGFYSMAVGGIIGKSRNLQKSLADCVNYSDIDVKATASSKYIHIGGISGYASGFQEECCNFGKINVEGENVASSCEVMLGGINGNGSEGGLLNNSYNRGDISIDFSTSGTFVGGISGGSYITRNSYNKCNIALPNDFAGYAGAISGSIGLGLPSVGDHPYVENVYYSETDLTVGYADCIHPDDVYEDSFEFIYKNFAELSDEDMKKQDSFKGFDFDETWAMEENGYPVLKNQPTISVSETVELEAGETYATEWHNYKWVSSNEEVAVINENGEIVALSAGTATVTIEFAYGYVIEYTVNVVEPVSVPTPDPGDKCPLADLWIIKVIKWVVGIVIDTVTCIFNAVAAVI